MTGSSATCGLTTVKINTAPAQNHLSLLINHMQAITLQKTRKVTCPINKPARTAGNPMANRMKANWMPGFSPAMKSCVSIRIAVRTENILIISQANFATVNGIHASGNRKTNRRGGFHAMIVKSSVEPVCVRCTSPIRLGLYGSCPRCNK